MGACWPVAYVFYFRFAFPTYLPLPTRIVAAQAPSRRRDIAYLRNVRTFAADWRFGADLNALHYRSDIALCLLLSFLGRP